MQNILKKFEQGHILVVSEDDDADLLDDWLTQWGFTSITAHSARAGTRHLKKTSFDVVILGLAEDSEETLGLIDLVRTGNAFCHVVFIDMPENPLTPAEALRGGAFQYLKRPLDSAEVRAVVDQALLSRRKAVAQHTLLKESRDRHDFESMIGKGDTMRRLFSLIERLADSSSAVLIQGESGTGKELAARAIHFRGQRAKGAFVAVNCAAIPETLLESELFGYEKGAFTGAHKPRPGLFVQASGGTLFLDEIGDLPKSLQPKILRALQEREVRPVGSDATRQVDVRIVAATHRNLTDQMKSGAFRSDLFYRLNVVSLKIPPLRERLEDIPFLVDAFLHKFRQHNPNLRVERVEPDVLNALMTYDWPGNIRELENALERAATLCMDTTISSAELEFIETVESPVQKLAPQELFKALPSLKELQRQYIDYVLEQVGGHRIKASAILEIDPSTLYRKNKKRA